MKSKIEIGYSVFIAMADCNLADSYDIDDCKINDLPYECSRDNSAFGFLGAALKSMGFKNEYQAFIDTGDIPDLKDFKADDGVESKKLTSTQAKIFRDNVSVTGYNNSTLYPLFGSGQYRAAYAMERLGYGEVVASQLNCFHAAGYFFTLADNTSFNFKTNTIEIW